MDAQNVVLQALIIFNSHDMQPNIAALINKHVVVVAGCIAVVHQSMNHALGLGVRVGRVFQHICLQPSLNHLASPLHGPLTIRYEGWRVLRKYLIPKYLLKRFAFHFLNSAIDLRENPHCRKTADLWISWAQTRMLTQQDLLRGTCNHCARRHCNLGHNRANILTKYFVEVLNY